MSTGADCPEKATLLEGLKTAITELMAIHNAQMEALIGGRTQAVNDFEQRITEARARKTEAVEALKAHLEEHRC